MPELSVTIPHHLSQQEALARIQARLSQAQQQYAANISNLKQEWNGNTGTFSFKAMGFDVAGKMTVEPDHVLLVLQLPMAAAFFKERIEAALKDDMSKTLGA
jgi:Putative polyhydroxyalkanoic acid system protein (PHA_gran_rgn)